MRRSGFSKYDVYSEPPWKNYVTKDADVFHIDDTCSMDLLDMNSFGPESEKSTDMS